MLKRSLFFIPLSRIVDSVYSFHTSILFTSPFLFFFNYLYPLYMSVAQPDTKTTTSTTFTTKNGTTKVHLPFLELLIRHAKQGIDQIKTWTTWEQPQNAVLALAFWCLLCLHFWTVLIYIVPLLPLLWTMQRWPTPTAEEDKDSKRNSSLYQQQHIDISVIDCVVALENMIRTSVESLQWEKHPNKTKKMFLVLVYAYVCWVTAHQLVDTCHIVMVTGILVLTWQSPWMIKARESARYPLSILTAIFLGSVQTNSDTCSLAHHVLTHQDKVMRRATNNPDFVFVLVENQVCIRIYCERERMTCIFMIMV